MAKRGQGEARPSLPARAPGRGAPAGKLAPLKPAAIALAVAAAAGVLVWREGPRFAAIVALGSLAAIGIGMILAWRLQRLITHPVLALARSMDEVQADHDYSRRLDLAAAGELGDLVDSFNSMMVEIGRRDLRIAAEMAALEQALAARSAELDQARAADRARSQALAAVNRDLKASLGGMMVIADRLAAGDLAPRQRRFMDVIARSGAGLLAGVDDILDPSKTELHTLAVDLDELADDIAALFWDRAASKGLDLAVYIDPATPRVIQSDPTRLHQALGALVADAVELTEVGGVLIEIEPDAAGSLRVSVRDTSPGMPRRAPGEGPPGLSICKRLVEAMGGRVNAASEVGKGACAAFRLPMTVVQPAAAWPAARAAGTKALIVHDGRSTRRALGRYLARAGYSLAGPGDETAAELVFGAASALPRQPAKTPTVCLADYGDAAPYDLLKAGTVHALLAQPLRRGDLEALLAQMEAGEPLRDMPAADESRAREVLPVFPGAHVLVADDSAVNREAIIRALARLSVRVSTAADGAQALETALSERFDLVLMSAALPGMDGLEATREIRRREAERGYVRTPIVALTPRLVGAAGEAWREAGMDAVLHKPFTAPALAKTLIAFVEPRAAPAAAPRAASEAGGGAAGRTITNVAAQVPPEVRLLLDDLAEAIATDQLSLVYQPQVDRDGQNILGVEALVRWTHPVRGFVSPADFIPMAEAWGSVHKVTDWVMNRAVSETADLDGLQVGFNASALEFIDAGIVARIQNLIERTGFDPRRLEVEITETAILENEDQVRENMNVLRSMGMKVALDDFGAGYSSLGHLRRYPFDKLKIDREFVIDCTQDVQSATVVHAVVSIGRALGMKVVAEGVETEQQRQFLRIAGVHAMQGYLFGRPVPIAALREILNAPRDGFRARA